MKCDFIKSDLMKIMTKGDIKNDKST